MSLFQFSFPGGRTEILHDDKHRVMTQLLAACDEANCEVKRKADLLEVEVPGWEIRWMPFLARSAFVRLFWDRISFSLCEDGSVVYRGSYGTLPQVALHLMIMLALAGEFWLGKTVGEYGVNRFIGIAILAHSLPLVLSALISLHTQNRLITRAKQGLIAIAAMPLNRS